MSALWLLLAIFPLQGLMAQSLQLILGPQGGQGHSLGIEYSLRIPHPEMLNCLGGLCQGTSLHTDLFKCERWIVGRTEFLRCVRGHQES